MKTTTVFQVSAFFFLAALAAQGDQKGKVLPKKSTAYAPPASRTPRPAKGDKPFPMQGPRFAPGGYVPKSTKGQKSGDASSTAYKPKAAKGYDPYAAHSDYNPKAAKGYDPYAAPSVSRPTDENGYDPNGSPSAYNPNTAKGYDPKAAPSGYSPNAVRGYDPYAAPREYDPNATNGYDPKAAKGYDPRAAKSYDPSATPSGYDPKAAKGYNPQAAPSGYDPKAAKGYNPQAARSGYTGDYVELQNPPKPFKIDPAGGAKAVWELRHTAVPAIKAIYKPSPRSILGFSNTIVEHREDLLHPPFDPVPKMPIMKAPQARRGPPGKN